VTPQSISKKAPRTYRSDLRQQQAEQTRARVFGSAAELFAADGYARTTLAKIAAAAGVSVETVQGLGPKAALFIAAIQHTGVGVVGEENVLNLEVGRKLLAVEDCEEAVDLICDVQVAVHDRVGLLALALFGGAASDPELDGYLADFLAGVHSQFRRALGVFRDRGWLRDDVPFDELVTTTAVLGGVETYLRLVHREGWSVEAYRAWTRRMLVETALVRPNPVA
jgi:AcrR family transcriptional regulator